MSDKLRVGPTGIEIYIEDEITGLANWYNRDAWKEETARCNAYIYYILNPEGDAMAISNNLMDAFQKAEDLATPFRVKQGWSVLDTNTDIRYSC